MDIVEITAKELVPQSPLSMGGVIGIVLASCFIGLIWAAWNYLQVKKDYFGHLLDDE